MSKYYTPKIEEFYVGFEYEEFVDAHPEGNWCETNITQVVDIEIPADDLEHHDGVDTRVKYLNKEDIESLGFKNSNLDKSIFLYKDKISILPHLPKTTIGINFNSGYSHLLIFNVPDENNIPAGVNLFVGTIKNKSELKKLLKQLNINE